MALALLTRDWVTQRGGSVLALVVDHGLRPESKAEAQATTVRLEQQRIASRLLTLRHLARGPALAERARTARYEVLQQACRQAGLLHLLVGHHAGDQAETMAMRVLRGSSSTGLSGIAALRETRSLRLLRPLLNVPPADLRRFLSQSGVGWVEDPSNTDQRTLRARLRCRMPSPAPALLRAACLAGQLRTREDDAIARVLAERVVLRPEGFATLTPGQIQPEALGALIRTVAGAFYPVPPSALTRLALNLTATTLGGVRLLPMRRDSPGFWVLREEARIASNQPAHAGMRWDDRFSLVGHVGPHLMVGKLGDAAVGLRAISALPAAILRTLPALWRRNQLAAVPLLGHYGPGETPVRTVFTPPWPLAGPDFRPSSAKDCNFRRLGEPCCHRGCTESNDTLC